MSTINFNSIKLVKAGTISGSEKSTGGVLTTSDAYYSFGGSSDSWGLSLSPSDINTSTFGCVVSMKAVGFATFNNTSRYLKATNFGFVIPTGATIDGVLVEIEAKQDGGSASVDHIRITVYYTETSSATIAGVQTMQGIQSITL